MPMDHRKMSLAFLRATGLIPVELNPDKSPRGGFSLVNIADVDKEPILKRLAEDKERRNLGALFAGRYVDVDIDSFDRALILALDAMLPATDMVWGRKSKPRSHRVYTLAEPYVRAPWTRQLATLEGLVIDDVSYQVEIRGGEPSHGMYAVLPGSKIDMGAERNVEKGYDPQGEMMEWASEFDPSVSGTNITAKELIDRIRMAQAIAILAPYWTEGSRNEMSLALSGLLWRIASLSESLVEEGGSEDQLVLNEEICERFLITLCDVAGDDPADRHTRVSNLHNTWRKLQDNPEAKITGGKRLSEFMGDAGPEIITKLYLLLSDDEQLRRYEELCSRFVVWYGEGNLVDLNLVKMGMAKPWMTRFQAQNSLGNERLLLGGEKKDVTNLLYSSPAVARVYGLQMEPDINEVVFTNKDGYKMVNQWHGFAVEPHPEKVPTEYMAPLIEYLHDVIAAGNATIMEWIISWIAHIFQTPGQKSRTALVLTSERAGTGKTFLGEHVIRPLIGPLHSVAVNSIEQVIGQFNSLLDNKIFVQANEAIHSHRYTAGQVLKSIISDDTATIEHKYVNTIEKSNHMRLFATSNRVSDAIHIDAALGERRFTVQEVSPVKAGDTEYWNNLAAWCASNRPRMMRFFLDWKIDRSFISRPLVTAAKARLQANNVPAELAWIIARLRENHILSEESHRYWFEAYQDGTLTKEDVTRNNLNRRKWPNLVSWKTVEEDFAAYAARRSRWIGTNSLGLLKNVLPDSRMVKQSKAKYRRMDGQQVEIRVRLYSLAPKQHIVDHLYTVYGKELIDSMLSGAMDEMVDEEVVPNGEAKF